MKSRLARRRAERAGKSRSHRSPGRGPWMKNQQNPSGTFGAVPSKTGNIDNSPIGVGPLSSAIVDYGIELPEEVQSIAVARPKTGRMKRILDLAICVPALVLLSPFLGMVALVIRMIDGGPVFYLAKRIGKDGIPFNCLKFRTMVVNAEALKVHLLRRNIHGKGITFKVLDDPRITWLGRIIRRWSIDELPQLWNVIRGDMTLVGPRPACPLEVARYSPSDRDRLTVKPGLTCIWQVSGRCQIPFEQQVQMDREYILNQSFFMDLTLILRTIPAVIVGKGAY